jgi:hypothetical protein
MYVSYRIITMMSGFYGGMLKQFDNI